MDASVVVLLALFAEASLVPLQGQWEVQRVSTDGKIDRDSFYSPGNLTIDGENARFSHWPVEVGGQLAVDRFGRFVLRLTSLGSPQYLHGVLMVKGNELHIAITDNWRTEIRSALMPPRGVTSIELRRPATVGQGHDSGESAHTDR
jgi:hypothetical protein